MLLLLAANVFCQVMWGHTNASRTPGGRFRGSVPLNELRSVHQKPFFSTECIFRTPGVPLWYRIQRQKIGKALRKEIPMYPPIAIREFVANALIHQDFYLGGSSPMIEIFGNRMEISNPGKPLIDIFRFIDHTPISRNEKLASLMRRMNICEERGCGVDRAITQCELYQLPAPDFQKTIYSQRSLCMHL